jgi:pimeloyl-ACP methyl ester carboxylesterase
MLADMLTTAKGLEFNYVSHGVGPTLVLLHAFPLNLRMWNAQIAALADSCHVLALDLPGFGASQTTDGDFTLDDLADDVHALLQRLGHDRIVLGGCSMGGYIALAYARRYRRHLRGLVLVDTRATADSEEGRQKRLTQAAEVEMRGTKSLSKAFPPSALAPSTTKAHPEMIDLLRTWIAEADPMAVAGAQRAMAARPDSSDLLATLDIPTLVIVGEQDALTPPAEADKMAAALPQAQLVRISGAGHLSPLEQPEAVNQAIKTFMRRFAS